MSNTAMIVRADTREVAFTPQAGELKQLALAGAALVARVSNADEQAVAVDALKELQRIIKLTEDSRTAAKAPLLELGRAIDAAAKQFVSEIAEERDRISQLVADYQQLEQARARAEQQRLNAELTALERARAEAIAQAKSHEEIDAINARHDDLVAAQQADNPAPTPPRTDGMTVRTEWDITIVDVWKLARAHPACVNITPRLSDIKALLDAGVTVAGVRAEKKVVAGVRVGKTGTLTVSV